MRLGKKSKQTRQSPIRAMSVLCEKKGGTNMAQGLCDLEVPEPVLRGCREAMSKGMNTYTPAAGIAPLREAVAEKQNSFYGQNVSADQVMISSGATGAFYSTASIVLDPEDEVIVFEPYYGYHVSTLLALNCRLRFITTRPPLYAFDPEELKQCITAKTRAILICNPGNPSGKVFTREELRQLGTIAEMCNLILFSDEIYEHFVFDSLKHVSALSIESLAERAVVVSGFSKIFSITGWRVGYAVAGRQLIEAATHVNDLVYVCPPAPLQYGVLQGVRELPESYYREAATAHQRKRDVFIQSLNRAGLPAEPVKGAYYVLADISRLSGENDSEKVIKLLEKTGVAAVPGDAFYHGTQATDQARFCFSKKEDELLEACTRLEDSKV